MYQIELAFGHCRSDGSKLPRHQIALARKRSMEVFSICFRGSQVYHPLGVYLTPENRMIIEPSTVIRAYAEKVDGYMQELLALCSEIAITLGQDCILLTVVRLQGTMQWVEPEATIPVAKQPILTSH